MGDADSNEDEKCETGSVTLYKKAKEDCTLNNRNMKTPSSMKIVSIVFRKYFFRSSFHFSFCKNCAIL